MEHFGASGLRPPPSSLTSKAKKGPIDRKPLGITAFITRLGPACCLLPPAEIQILSALACPPVFSDNGKLDIAVFISTVFNLP
jgi:hypothetical protein